MKTDSTNFIERQLSQFKRKYWLTKLLQGTLIFSGTGVVFFGLIALFEYFSWLSSTQRTILFFVLLFVEGALIAFYLGWPLLQLLLNGKALTDKKAAHIIGNNLAGIQDKLMNYLQLKEFPVSNELIDAGLQQKSRVLKDYQFRKAISLGSLKPFLLFLVPLVLFLGFVLSGNRWFMLEEGTNRLLNFSTEYKKTLPFDIVLERELFVNENDDLEVMATIDGKLIPEQLIIESSKGRSTIVKTNGNQFKYTFQNCIRDLDFRFLYDDIASEDFTISVIKKAIVGRVAINVRPPSYTGVMEYDVENTPSLVVPQFSQVSVQYSFKNTNELVIYDVGTSTIDTVFLKEHDKLEFNASTSHQVQALAESEILSSIKVDVLKDMRPNINVFVDSLEQGIILNISANDDYEITNASLKLIEKEGGENQLKLPFQNTTLQSSIPLSWADLVLLSNAQVVVNDHVGSSTKIIELEKFLPKEQSEEELNNEASEGIESIKETAASNEKQEKLPGEKREKLKSKAAEINKTAEKLSKRDSALYQRFEELSEEIMKLANEMEKEIPESRKKMKEEKLEEKIKALEKEWMILQTIEELKRLEDSLKTKSGAIEDKQMKDLKDKANDLENNLKENNEADKVDWKKFDEIQKNNESLKDKENQNTQSSEKEKNQDSKSDSEEQKNGEQELKDEMKEDSEDLREQLGEMSDIMMMEATQKNIELLRRLELRSLKSSKKQEEIYTKATAQTEVDRSLMVSQKEVLQSSRVILDSLSALTVSNADLAMVLNENQYRLDQHIAGMESSDPSVYRSYVSSQRYLQYGLNDLAAILYDILKQEQENMMNMKSGNKQCNKPKPGNGKKPSMSKKQKELGKKMGQMKQKGKSKGKQSFSQGELLQLIKGQEEVISDYKQEAGKKDGDGKLAEELNKQLDDLIKGDIDKALERNKDIEDKLITFEESVNKKKEQEDNRQSKENTLDYEAIKRSITDNYIKTNQRGTSIVNLPALKNYFTGKWITISQ